MDTGYVAQSDRKSGRTGDRSKSPGSSAEQAERARKQAISKRRARPRRKRREEGTGDRPQGRRRASAREKKLAETRIEEQAAIDRKRWYYRENAKAQEQAAKAKVVADKLAKEQARRDAEQQKIENARLEEERKIAEKHQKAQDKLAREQASRNDELEKLITQDKRLTGE